jgi:biopolymer transport protein ExbD
MAFNNSSDQEMMSEINVTPLVDVMLVLLVVFIVTAPLLTQAVRVNLPKTGATEPAKETRPSVIAVMADGQVLLDERKLSLEELERDIKALITRDAQTPVHVQADEKALHGTVAKVLAAVQRAGVSKLAIVTREQ